MREVHLLAERGHAALEAEQRHRHGPAFAGPADDVLRCGARTVEEHFVELGAPGELANRADLDARLRQRHEKEAQAPMTARSCLAAREHEDPVRLACPRGPDLLAVEDPVAAGRVALRARLHVGEVGACTRLGEALAPVLGAARDAWQKALALFLAAQRQQRRPEQPFADVADAPRPAGSRVLLVKDHLALDGQRAAAPGFGSAVRTGDGVAPGATGVGSAMASSKRS